MPDAIRVFAPASIGNVGVGFDVLGLALAEVGDTVVARRTAQRGVRLSRVTGAEVPTGPTNTAVVAARAVLDAVGADVGVELELLKGMAVGTGMGSSAASAAAAAFATNRLLGDPLPVADLVEPCARAEQLASGYHADNVAPALLGGLVLVRSLDPLDVVSLPVPPGLWVCLVRPHVSVSTRHAREVLPKRVPLEEMVRSSANLGAFVAACYRGDLDLLGRSLQEHVVTPVRAALVPGASEALDAAADVPGVLGASISGAGPSVFALTRDRASAEVCAATLKACFIERGLDATTLICAADNAGAREVSG